MIRDRFTVAFIEGNLFRNLLRENVLTQGREGKDGDEKEQERQKERKRPETLFHLTVSPSIMLPGTVTCFGTCVSGDSMASVIRLKVSLAIWAVSWR